MGKIDELIQQYCPEGVEYVPIGDYLSYEQPTRYLVESTKYDDSYTTPVLTAGQSFILGYTKETSGIFDASRNNPVIIFDDFTTSFHWVEFSFKVKSSAMKMLRPTNESKALFRYLYHCMKNVQYVPGDHTRQWIGTYSQFEIPLPPLPVQEAIVNILDRFAVYAAELQAELQARQQQYNYYRDTLLSFEGRDDVQWKKLGEVLKIKNGRDYKHLNNGNVPVYGSGGVMTYVDTQVYDKPSVLIPRKGSIDKLYYVDCPFWNVDTIFYTEINASIVIEKYVFYILQKEHLEKLNTGGGVPSLTQKVLNGVVIPIPPLSEQQRIVDILDRFDTLVNDLSQGLPAEIEARQQQYEYYRDQLLTFKRNEA